MELHSDIHPGTGPHLLLVHGFLSSRAQFEPNLAALAEVSRPVVVELWGHGRSPLPEDPAMFHPDAYVEAFERLRKRLGVEQWMVCGQSLGAGLTLRYALDHPEHTLAHIFTNSTSALADAEWAENVRQGSAMQAEYIMKGGREAIEQMPIHPKKATRMPENVKALLLEDVARIEPAAVARTMQYTVPEVPMRDRIGANRVPTLLVCGTREKRFEPYRAFAEQAMPEIEIVCVEAGHAVNIESAEAFNAAAVAFVRRQMAA